MIKNDRALKQGTGRRVGDHLWCAKHCEERGGAAKSGRGVQARQVRVRQGESK